MMVPIPWHDGTTREVEEGTLVFISCKNAEDRAYAGFVRWDGVVLQRTDEGIDFSWESNPDFYVVALLEPSDTVPPIKVEIPAKIGAIVGDAYGCCILTHCGWISSNTLTRVKEELIEKLLTAGKYKVVSTGVELEHGESV